MTDCQMSRQALQGAFAENVTHQPHVLVNNDPAAVTGNNAGTFLAAVLQGVQAEIGQSGRVLTAEYSADAAFVSWFERMFLDWSLGSHLRIWRASGGG
jgi:hypothetical protein